MASKPTASYHPRLDATPEQARDIRARALAFIFQCYGAKRKGAAPRQAASEDATKGPNYDRAKNSLPRTRT